MQVGVAEVELGTESTVYSMLLQPGLLQTLRHYYRPLLAVLTCQLTLTVVSCYSITEMTAFQSLEPVDLCLSSPRLPRMQMKPS